MMIDIVGENTTIAIVSLFAAVSVAFLFLFRRSTDDAPPRVNAGIPFVGNVIAFVKGPLPMIKKLYGKAGPVFTAPMAGKPVTFLIGPEAQAAFFKAKDDVLSQNEVYGFMKPVFGSGVVYDAEPMRRSEQMKAMSNGLRSSRLQSYVPLIEMEVRNFIKDWGESGEVDIAEALSELTILTASRCLHGHDVRDSIHAQVAHLYHDLDQGITPISFFLPNLPIPAHFRRNAARIEMCKLFGKIIEERKKLPKESSEKNLDILQIFIDLKYKDGGAPTNEEITGLLIALLFAGQHTSSISSTLTMAFLMLNPDIMARVNAEQERIVGAKTKNIEWDHLGDMELLHNCMKEALRLHPPLIMLMRYCKQAFQTSANGKEYTIPKGHIVITSPALAMRIPEVFKDPDRFDPDRFAPPREEHKPPYSYLGFGGGMHQCMGQNFGFLQVKTILSTLVRHYQFEMVEPKLPEINYSSMVAGPKGSIMARYKSR